MKAILKHWKDIDHGFEIDEQFKPLYDGKTVRELSDVDMGEGDRMLIREGKKDYLIYGDEYTKVSGNFKDIEELFEL